MLAFIDKVYSNFFGGFGAGKAVLLVDSGDLELSQLGPGLLSKYGIQYGTSFKKIQKAHGCTTQQHITFQIDCTDGFEDQPISS